MSLTHTRCKKLISREGKPICDDDTEVIEYDVTIDGDLVIKEIRIRFGDRDQMWKLDLKDLEKTDPDYLSDLENEIWEKYPIVQEGIAENEGLSWAKDQKVSNE